MKKNFEEFTAGMYPILKTVRFELIPQGETANNMADVIAKDEERAENYKKAKLIIDEYHRNFIDEALGDIKELNLESYVELFKIKNKSEKEKDEFKSEEVKLRKEIVDVIKNNPKFSTLFKKELIKEDIFDILLDREEDTEIMRGFNNFTTYFQGFYENRKNMYTDEEKSTAIAYRIINQNLPKFLDNQKVFETARKVIDGTKFKKLIDEMPELFTNSDIKDYFKTENYFKYITQKGIDTYNNLIGGKSEEGRNKIKGLNEYINEYNQIADKKIGKLKPLYKQILSDREGTSLSFIPEKFSLDKELLCTVKQFHSTCKPVFDLIKDITSDFSMYDTKKIFIKNDLSITDLSKKINGDWSFVYRKMEEEYDRKFSSKKQTESYIKKRQKYIKKIESFSICKLDEYLGTNAIEKYFSDILPEIFVQVFDAYLNMSEMLSNYPEERNLISDDTGIAKIKKYLDSVKYLQNIIKPLLGKGTEADKDERFYGDFVRAWSELDAATALYNKVRNYVTQKPYSTEKIKLNFDNSTLLDGWDLNKEMQNSGIILEKDGLYYLAVLTAKNKNVFTDIEADSSRECFNKMEYKLLSKIHENFPRVFFAKSNIDFFNPSNDILRIRKEGTFKKGEKFNKNDLYKMIDFYKESLNKHPEWCNFEFTFSDTKEYEDISMFYKQVENQGYKITYKKIPVDYIENLVKDGKLYLFKIYNKDFSKFSKGKPNLHTLYWKMLFDERNLRDVVYKLNGKAEIFYRKASIKNEDIIIHPAKQDILNKNPNTDGKFGNFDYAIIKNRRYTVDKFMFHVPITLNFKANGPDIINESVNYYLKNADDIHVIGIDRGERHLLYLSVIDDKGNIVEQISLNKIVNEYNGTTHQIDYHELLNRREKERDSARKNWKSIENIKELKEGYLSQVIYKISHLMVKYNAIVVLEDLNSGFMRGRQKVEKQVYQKFERMLINKLNYFVDKDTAPEEPGGLLKAYQLANKLDKFENNQKQCGFLFYVPAWNTSKIDPVTGFVNLFYGSDLRYASVEQSKNFFATFEDIRFNGDEDHFEFTLDYNNFNSRGEGTKTLWTICSNDERIETFKNKEKNGEWDNKIVDLTDALKRLFTNYNIDYEKETLKEQICKMERKDFYQELYHLLRLILQMRNSINGTDVDYLISPVKNYKGEFFDSRILKKNMPIDADANGAYNIARKGLWAVSQIRDTPDENLGKVKLAISNKEWLKFVQESERRNG